MNKQLFYRNFLKIIKDENGNFKPLTEELMKENNMLEYFRQGVKEGFFYIVDGFKSYYINWDLFKAARKEEDKIKIEQTNSRIALLHLRNELKEKIEIINSKNKRIEKLQAVIDKREKELIESHNVIGNLKIEMSDFKKKNEELENENFRLFCENNELKDSIDGKVLQF